MNVRQTIPWADFSDKHKQYIKNALDNKMNVAEGAIRSGKTIDHCIIAAAYLEKCKDKIHLASGSTIGNAKLNIGVCNGFGLENLFRGRCKWGKYRDNEALFIQTQTGEKVVVFAGGGKADSYKRILGNSYGLWIATEINEHYDSEDSRTSFVKVAFGRQAAAIDPLVLWDLNPCGPNNPIYIDYIDKYKDGYIGGYQYQHFTLDDNLSISAQRKAEIKSQYNPSSVWYRRDILGERCTAEGLIYQQFADNKERFIVDKIPDNQWFISIGLDWGGNRSLTAFVATMIHRDFKKIGFIKDHHITGKKGTIDGDRVNIEFIQFAKELQAEYNVPVKYTFCDSAEQYLNTGLAKAVRAAGMNIVIGDSHKAEIIQRIICLNTLFNTGRVYVLRRCNLIINGLLSAAWDTKAAEKGLDKRLDNFTSDIDIVDATEYSFSRWLPKLTPHK